MRVALDGQVLTIAEGIEVLERGDQRVLINPVNRRWIKLEDHAYELVLNPRGKSVRQLVAEESLQSGVEPCQIESLFHYLAEYRFLAGIGEAVTLSRAYLNITARCNLACPMCYFETGPDPGSFRHDDCSLDDLLLIADALGHVKVGTLVISGGEPLLCRDFREILSYVSRRFARVTVLTNGTLMTYEDAECISDAMATVQISIESANPRVHDSIRGPGSFDKAIAGISMLREAGAEKIEIVQTLTRRGVREARGVIELARALGVDYHFSLFLPVGRGSCHKGDMEIPAGELLRLFTEVCEKSPSPGEFLPPVELMVKQRCGAGSSIMSIGPDGKVYPCPLMHTDDMVLGKLPIDPVWEIARRGTQRMPDVKSLSQCFSCNVALFCGGGCRARALAHTGDVFSQDPYCHFYCRVYEAILWEWREDREFSRNIKAVLRSVKEGPEEP